MIKKILTLSFLLCAPVLFGQIQNFGVEFNRNFNTQLNFDPAKPKDGIFQWNTLQTNGFGVFMAFNTPIERFVPIVKMKYLVKGGRETAQLLREPGNFSSVINSTFENKFHFLSADMILNYDFIKAPDVKIGIYGGLRHSFMLNYTIESNISPINRFYPVKYYSNFSKYNLGWILGVRLSINDLIFLEGETSQDINYSINSDRLQMRNWSGSLNAGINILKLKKSSNKRNLNTQTE